MSNAASNDTEAARSPIRVSDVQVKVGTAKETEEESEDKPQTEDEAQEEETNPLLQVLPVNPIVLRQGQGICGLCNLGNTCYLNSIIQALSNLPTISTYFHVGWPYVAPPIIKSSNRKRKEFCDHFANLLRVMWSGKKRVLKPYDVTRHLINSVPEFQMFGQQDAQEALNYILNHLHDELCYETPPIYHPAREFIVKFEREDIKRKKSLPKSNEKNGNENDQLRLAHRPFLRSIVSDTFSTLLAQQIKCAKCGYSSESLEELMELSVELPTKQQLKDNKKMYNNSSNPAFRKRTDSNTSTTSNSSNSSQSNGTGIWKMLKNTLGMESHSLNLTDCLMAFFSPEKLKGEEQYFCEHCKSKQDATKIYSLAHLPEVMCIHLKRFNKVSGWGLGNSKNSVAVQYPINGLDLNPYTYSNTNNLNEHCKNANCLYDLVAVVRHNGGINSGHYIATCKNHVDNNWYEYDDDYIDRIKEVSEVQTADAYLLFYNKRPTSQHVETKRLVKETMLACYSKPIELEERIYLPLSWVLRFESMVSPGVVYDCGLACEHGELLWPFENDAIHRVRYINAALHRELQKHYNLGETSQLHGSLVSLNICKICQEKYLKRQGRRAHEIEQINRTDNEKASTWYIISNSWLKSWHDFVQNTSLNGPGRGSWLGVAPPGSISNHTLLKNEASLEPKPNLKAASHYRGVNKKVWDFFQTTYGGGPAIVRPAIDIYSQPAEE